MNYKGFSFLFALENKIFLLKGPPFFLAEIRLPLNYAAEHAGELNAVLFEIILPVLTKNAFHL